jgi:hypothetical protein
VTETDLEDAVDRLPVLAEYGRRSRELFALARKRAVLAVEKSGTELAASEEYAALTDRLDALGADLDRSIDEVDEEPFAASFRPL